MAKEKIEMKSFNAKIPKDIWMFLKNYAAANEITMTDIICNYVDKLRKKVENKQLKKLKLEE